MAPSVAQAQPPGALRAGPGYHEPAVGQCYDLSCGAGGEALRRPRTRSPATPPHTLMTVKVKRLSKPVNLVDRPVAQVRGPVHEGDVRRHRRPKLAAMSAYQLWFFMPTEEERAKGARWIRCDVGLRAGRTGMDRLPTSVGPSTSLPLAHERRPLPGAARRCATDGVQQRSHVEGEEGVQAAAVGDVRSAVPEAGPPLRPADEHAALRLRRSLRSRSGRPATTGWCASSATEPLAGRGRLLTQPPRPAQPSLV